MLRILPLAGLIAALALGSCVSQRVALEDGFAWSYQNLESEGPKLAYGAPFSDNVVLMMTCDAGADRARISLPGGSSEAGLILISGRTSASLDGETVASPVAGHALEVGTPLDARPMARFRRTGDLTLVDRRRTVPIDARGSERAAVKRFFKACRRQT